MQVIYLDQNAACFLAKSNPDAIWLEIREALAKGFHDGKLRFPHRTEPPLGQTEVPQPLTVTGILNLCLVNKRANA